MKENIESWLKTYNKQLDTLEEQYKNNEISEFEYDRKKFYFWGAIDCIKNIMESV